MPKRYLETEFVRSALTATGVDFARATPAIVAACVVERFRKGSMPSAEECERLNGPPLIDEIRKAITSEDLAWIWDNIEPAGNQKAAFCVSMLRLHCENAEVQACLKKLWSKAKPYVRTHLLWRILDDPSLGPEWHLRLFEFVLDQWDIFQAGAKAFTGSTDEEVLVRALERFGDASFPETKMWAYLCTAAGAVDRRPNSVRAILDLGSHSPDGNTRHVASTLRSRLFDH